MCVCLDTGRMAYRGKVINRTARLANMARYGEIWMSLESWMEASEYLKSQPEIKSVQLGAFALKVCIVSRARLTWILHFLQLFNCVLKYTPLHQPARLPLLRSLSEFLRVDNYLELLQKIPNHYQPLSVLSALLVGQKYLHPPRKQLVCLQGLSHDMELVKCMNPVMALRPQAGKCGAVLCPHNVAVSPV